jgi:hypothetical protein
MMPGALSAGRTQLAAPSMATHRTVAGSLMACLILGCRGVDTDMDHRVPGHMMPRPIMVQCPTVDDDIYYRDARYCL